jgi:hypothetical protein
VGMVLVLLRQLIHRMAEIPLLEIFTSSLTTSNLNWKQYTCTFTVTAGSHTISFNFSNSANNDPSIGLTNILIY